MLELTVPGTELFDERTQTFTSTKSTVLQLEHSLIAIAKWEAKFHKSFLSPKPGEERTQDESLYYVKCMTINKGVDPKVYLAINDNMMKRINEYIDDPMSATKFYDDVAGLNRGRAPKETITAELIYWWMIANNISPDKEKWHINRLLALIRVCNIKNQPPKKNGRLTPEQLKARADLNAARRAKTGSRG